MTLEDNLKRAAERCIAERVEGGTWQEVILSRTSQPIDEGMVMLNGNHFAAP